MGAGGTNKGLFMDMDHTVIRPGGGRRFSKDKNDWEFVPGVLEKMRRFNDLGYVIMVVSNQAGIELGYTTVSDASEKFASVVKAAGERDVVISDYVFSTTSDADDPNRKPNPGMAELLKYKFDIDLDASVMVGDMDSDKKFAENAGISEFYYIDDFLKLKI